MRPSTRHVAAIGRLHVPGRVVPSYVCRQCQLATQRDGLSAYRPSHGFVRHASSNKPPEKEEEIKFTERFRRKIWGTDNPPGQKDPYSPASPEERARMEKEEQRLQEDEARQAKTRRGWLGRKKEEQPAPPEDAVATAQQLDEAHAKAVAVKPRKQRGSRRTTSKAPIMIPTTEEAEEFGYVPAATMKGLPRMGVKHDAIRELEAFMDENPFIPYIGSRKVKPAAAPRIVKQALSLVLTPDGAEAAEAASSQAQPPPVAQIMDRWTSSDGTVYRLEGEVQAGERPWTELDISQDLAFKFSLIKQVMRLSRSRIPDPAIAGFRTVGEIVAHLEVPARPTALVELLLQDAQLRALPNLEIKSNTRTRTKIDDEFGWHKEIRKEYKRRGLLHGRQPNVPVSNSMDALDAAVAE